MTSGRSLKRIFLGAITLGAIASSVLIARAINWNNFKLQNAALTQVLHDQSQELDDIKLRQGSTEIASRIKLDELLNGGPPKDGIPSIDQPKFDTAATTPFLPTDIVVGVVINGEAKAYPYKILNWHEIVNDTLGGINLTVSYCPLCDTIVTFNRGESTFGVSGKLYQSCLVMYDRADDSLYAQPWAMGIIGEQANYNLERIPAVKTTLEDWLAKYPNSQILSTDTGYERDYTGYPYGTYYTNERIIFPVRNQEALAHHPKAIVSYIWEPNTDRPFNKFSGASQQFVHSEIEELGEKTVEFNDRQVIAKWNEDLATVIVSELDGEIIPSSTAFAFVYPAFFEE